MSETGIVFDQFRTGCSHAVENVIIVSVPLNPCCRLSVLMLGILNLLL